MWMLNDDVFAGARVVVSARPKVDVALAAGVGGLVPISASVAAFAEADLVGGVGGGAPDAGLAATGGAFYSF